MGINITPDDREFGQFMADTYRKPFAQWVENGMVKTVQVGLLPHPDDAAIYEPVALEQGDKITFCVVNGHTLGYIQPNTPKGWYHVLAASVLLGAELFASEQGMTVLPLTPGATRPATRADFDTFRIHTGGYEDDPRYAFPTE